MEQNKKYDSNKCNEDNDDMISKNPIVYVGGRYGIYPESTLKQKNHQIAAAFEPYISIEEKRYNNGCNDCTDKIKSKLLF